MSVIEQKVYPQQAIDSKEIITICVSDGIGFLNRRDDTEYDVQYRLGLLEYVSQVNDTVLWKNSLLSREDLDIETREKISTASVRDLYSELARDVLFLEALNTDAQASISTPEDVDALLSECNRLRQLANIPLNAFLFRSLANQFNEFNRYFNGIPSRIKSRIRPSA